MVVQAFNPSTRYLRQVDLCELQQSQGYIIEKPCLKDKNKQTKTFSLLQTLSSLERLKIT